MMAQHQIYLDYAAATPLDVRVQEAMEPYFAAQFYNPSSPYLAAKQVRQALEDARARVAHWLGAKTAEVIFTAGATESVNLAIHGVMRSFPDGEIVTTPIEHDGVLESARQYGHHIIAVNADGTVRLDTLRQAITDKTVLISVGYANNEIGTIQPLKDIAAVVHEVRRLRQLKNNQMPLYLHSDASQAECYLDLHASRLGVDLLTLNGGKMYGPKQTGVLFIKTGTQLRSFLHGGGQEGGLRSGTENIAGAVGLATALDIAQSERKVANQKLRTLRDQLERELVPTGALVNGNPKRRLPHILHVSWRGVSGERLLMTLDEMGLMASTGSACAANKQTASHVLNALGLSADAIGGSLRLSLGRNTTEADITEASVRIKKALKVLSKP